MTREEIKNYRKEFPYLSKDVIEYLKKHSKKVTERGFRNELKRENDKFEALANELPVIHIDIEIAWKKNQTWGYNPTATAWVQYSDKSWKSATARCSGCGYDKASTVVAEVLTELCSGMLWRNRRRAKKAPYGARYNETGWPPAFEGGIGMNCYYDVAKFLGGKMEHVANAKTYDKYVFTF